MSLNTHTHVAHADDVLSLHSEETGEMVYDLVGVVPLDDRDFVLYLPESPTSESGIDEEAPLMVLELIGEELYSLDDDVEFANICEEIKTYLDNYQEESED